MISSIILGFVQGLTEFLPISSSGHLIVVRDLLNITIAEDLLFDVFLHLATALAIIVYFRSDIKDMIIRPRENKTLWTAIIIGTVPVALLGPFFSDSVRNSYVVALALIAGSVVFFLAEKVASQDKELTTSKGFWIGVLQVLALIPGVSRSGITISGGLILGMTRGSAARFGFFLGLPAILGAGLVSGLRSMDVITSGDFSGNVIVGSITAFVTGLLAIHYLLRFLRSHKLTVFAWYRIGLAVIILVFL